MVWYALFLRAWSEVRTGDWNPLHGLSLPPAPGLVDADPSKWLLYLQQATLQAQLWTHFVLNHSEPHGRPFGSQSSFNTIWRTRAAQKLKLDLFSLLPSSLVLLCIARDPWELGHQGISLLSFVWLSFPPISPPSEQWEGFSLASLIYDLLTGLNPQYVKWELKRSRKFFCLQ